MRWEEWCRKNTNTTGCKYNAAKPTVPQFICYLAHLCKSLRHSTVENHASALFNFMSDSSRNEIKSATQYQKFAAGLHKSQPRVMGAIVWSVQPVLEFLSKAVFPEHHLYYLGRHIALL